METEACRQTGRGRHVRQPREASVSPTAGRAGAWEPLGILVLKGGHKRPSGGRRKRDGVAIDRPWCLVGAGRPILGQAGSLEAGAWEGTAFLCDPMVERKQAATAATVPAEGPAVRLGTGSHCTFEQAVVQRCEPPAWCSAQLRGRACRVPTAQAERPRHRGHPEVTQLGGSGGPRPTGGRHSAPGKVVCREETALGERPELARSVVDSCGWGEEGRVGGRRRQAEAGALRRVLLAGWTWSPERPGCAQDPNTRAEQRTPNST